MLILILCVFSVLLVSIILMVWVLFMLGLVISECGMVGMCFVCVSMKYMLVFMLFISLWLGLVILKSMV